MLNSKNGPNNKPNNLNSLDFSLLVDENILKNLSSGLFNELHIGIAIKNSEMYCIIV